MHESVASVGVKADFPIDQFVFGQFKPLKFTLTRLNDGKIDNIWIFSSNPLATGFLVRKVDSDFQEPSKVIEIIVRATIAQRRTDNVDLLFVVQSGGHLRMSLTTFEFRVNSSFKSKCMVEDISENRLLVGIDVFENREQTINPISFNVKALALLSESHSIDSQTVHLPMQLANLLTSQKMIYFIINLFTNGNAEPRERMHHKVCYQEENVSHPAGDANPFTEAMTAENLLGFFTQESKSIKDEFSAMVARTKRESNCDVSLKCHEFLDFELLWSYQNIGLFGREAAVFSPDNDPEIHGIHSILSTHTNMLSLRYKKAKPLTAPAFRIIITGPKTVKHDFSKSRFCRIKIKISVKCLYMHGNEEAVFLRLLNNT